MKKLLLTLILCLTTSIAFGATDTHYVTEAGAIGRTGVDLANAFSAADFNNSAKWDVDVADDNLIGPGDTVYFSGTFTSEIEPQGSGTAGNYITLDGYETDDTTYKDLSEAGGRALIDRTAEASGSLYCFDIGWTLGTAISYLIIQDFEMQNFSHGIYAQNNSNNIIIRRNYIHNGGMMGINLSYTSWITVGGAAGHGNVVKNTGVGTAGGDIVFGVSNNIIVSYNRCYATLSTDAITDRGIDGIVASTDSHTSLIEYNLVHNHNDLYDYDAFPPCGANCSEVGEDGIDLKERTYDIVIRYNYVYDNGGLYDNGGTNGASINISSVNQTYNIYIYGNRLSNSRWGGI